MPTLREGMPSDFEQLRVLWKALFTLHASWGYAFQVDDESAVSWTDSFEKTLGRFSFLWVVENECGELGGFLLMRVAYTPGFLGRQAVAQISELYVGPQLRDSGWGSRLVDIASAKATELALHSLEVQAMFANEAGRSFWEKQGMLPELIQFRRRLL